MMKIECQSRLSQSRAVGRLKRRAAQLARALVKHFAVHRVVKRSRLKRKGENFLTVIFVGGAESKKLNRRYRNKNYATDVLSFSPEARGEGLGELVLCVPVLGRQAKSEGHSVEREMETLLIHGFLHLLGYDHEKSRKEELKMMKLQDRLLKRLTKPRA